LKAKNEHLEELLRISTHTVETLQRQLSDVQAEYKQNLEAMDTQMLRFYEILKQKNTSNSASASKPTLKGRRSKDGDVKTWNVPDGDHQDVSNESILCFVVDDAL
jgi:hypothetical protein